MKIAMVASEANPLCKTGGLADVIFALGKELVASGSEVAVILPFYKCIKDAMSYRVKKLGSYEVFLSWRKQTANIYSVKIRGITYYLVGNDYYFNRDGLYGFQDDGERFAFFTLATRRLFSFVDFSPDIIHIHDWQAGMLPVLIKEQSSADPCFHNTKFVLTIHNEAFLGAIDRYFLNHFYGLDDRLYDEGKVRFNGMVSTLKSAIVYSDLITTVSPSHAAELLQDSNDLNSLAGVLAMRKDAFVGILNGIDTEEFDPMNDLFIPKNYDADSIDEGKAACKDKLLRSCFLSIGDEPVFGMISRLTFQKGIELAVSCCEKLLRGGSKVVVLGQGEPDLERQLEALRSKYPESMGLYIGYNNQFAHDIYAGSDFFIMPSRFEPCGIGQMASQRYGTLPVVRSVGGLADTVHPYEEKGRSADGFAFKEYSERAFEASLGHALDVYEDKALLRELRRNAMSVDHSWTRSAAEYCRLYALLLS